MTTHTDGLPELPAKLIRDLALQHLGQAKRIFYTRWKDGIDLDYPTIEIERFALAIYAEGIRIATQRLREELEAAQRIIRRASTIMAGGEGVQDQGEAWDKALRVLDNYLSAIDAAISKESDK